MGERLLSFTEYIENVLCIYRNCYLVKGRKRKLLMVLRVLLALSLILAHMIIRMLYYPLKVKEILYFYLTTGNSALVIVLAVYHGKRYSSFKRHLNYGYKFFIRDENYRQNDEANQSAFIGLVFFIGLCKIGSFMYSLIYPDVLPNIPLLWHYLLQINILVCDLRYIFEYLVLYSFLYVTYEQINLIMRSLDCDTCLLNDDVIIEVSGNKSIRLMTQVQKWSIGYRHVRQSCKSFNTIFGFQLTFIITADILFYIIYLYTSTSQSVTGHISILNVAVHIASVILMLYILYMLSQSAQQMQNSADMLRRRLCKVLIMSLSDGGYYQATRDLLRMMSTRPIRVHAFAGVSVDMTLLPTSISLFTTYTVIALQFNNVL